MNPYAEELRMMRVQGAPVDSQTSGERARLIQRINQVALEERQRSRERKQWLGWGSAAVLLMVGSFSLSFFLTRQEQSSLALESQQQHERVTGRRSQKAQDAFLRSQASGGTNPSPPTMVSPELGEELSPSEARLVSGATLRAETGAQYTVTSQHDVRGRRETVKLSSGRIELAVPALGAEVLAVQTHDTKVVVHGTKFSVALVQDEQGGARTLVEVSEGLVAVHSSGEVEYLRPGAVWSSSAESRSAPNASETIEQGKAQAPKPSAKTSPAFEGTLSLENGLYAEAMQRKLAGDYAGALTALDTLLSNYPGSPLASSANKARKKLRLMLVVETRK